ncbi:septum formation protein Maf [Candidatus Acetothermia bacterium]|nr:septum formation protein Maf [Candidatus Acetothermia bacterium]MBI3644213.1 septum formation protein Maf [Candidatus Acetothermia bacterium]
MTIPIILASASPRREALLRQIGVCFEVVASDISEDFEAALSPREVVRLLSKRKCLAVAAKRPEALVIAADTVVSLDGQILGKPASAGMATKMLAQLNNRTHQVITGVVMHCADKGILEAFEVASDVTFGNLYHELIEEYIKTGEPLDKAGAYAIQGIGALLVQSIRGSYSNIVGLPLFEVAELVRKYVGKDAFFRS